MWFFFKEPRDKKLDSIRCGRRFVSKRVRRGGLPRRIAGIFFFFIRAKPQRNLTALFLFFLASRFFIGGTPYLVHCLTAAGRSLFSFSRKGAKTQREVTRLLCLFSWLLCLASCYLILDTRYLTLDT